MHAVKLRIANLAISLRSDDAAMIERIRSRYAAFLAEADTPHATVVLTVQPYAQFLQPQPNSTWQLNINVEGDRLLYESYLEKGVLDLASGEAQVTMAPHAEIENFLRVLVAWLCLQNRSLLLHAAGVVHNGQGFVFFGPSGAGKSTVARISAELPHTHILSDDLIIVRRQGDHYLLCGVPFAGEMAEAPRLNMTAPLKGVFRLRQGMVNEIRPIPRTLAITELAACAPYAVQHRRLGDQLIAICADLTQNLAVDTLQFTRTPSFWATIYEHFNNVP